MATLPECRVIQVYMVKMWHLDCPAEQPLSQDANHLVEQIILRVARVMCSRLLGFLFFLTMGLCNKVEENDRSGSAHYLLI